MNVEHPLTQAILAGWRKAIPVLEQRGLDAGETADFVVEPRLATGMALVPGKV